MNFFWKTECVTEIRKDRQVHSISYDQANRVSGWTSKCQRIYDDATLEIDAENPLLKSLTLGSVKTELTWDSLGRIDNTYTTPRSCTGTSDSLTKMEMIFCFPRITN